MNRPTPGNLPRWFYYCQSCGATTQRPYHAPSVECGLCGRRARIKDSSPSPENTIATVFATILKASYTDEEASYIARLESLFAV